MKGGQKLPHRGCVLYNGKAILMCVPGPLEGSLGVVERSPHAIFASIIDSLRYPLPYHPNSKTRLWTLFWDGGGYRRGVP